VSPEAGWGCYRRPRLALHRRSRSAIAALEDIPFHDAGGGKTTQDDLEREVLGESPDETGIKEMNALAEVLQLPDLFGLRTLGESTVVCAQPVAGSQVSVVQGLLSSQFGAEPATQCPF
jgi:hypothetical protein